jgi:hypothetical protein
MIHAWGPANYIFLLNKQILKKELYLQTQRRYND